LIQIQQQQQQQQEKERQRTMMSEKTTTTLTEEEQYFSSYGTIETHELMLKDKVRTETYLRAIQTNADHFKDKIVLDVGCGTGVLSMFAVKYGHARKVYAVEASNISHMASQLVERNNMQGKIQVIHGLMENVVLPEKVDVIISEWMGFYLLHESMLDSVLVARDKWLKDGGIMFPSRANIYACPCSMDYLFQEKVHYWENVYGLDFSIISSIEAEKLLSKPYISAIKADQLLSDRVLIKEIDIKTVRKEELHHIFTQTTFLTTREAIMQGICIWFDVVFTGSNELIVLDTAPGLPDTHWKQTIILLPEHFQIQPGLEIPASIEISIDSSNHRHYNLSVQIGNEQESKEDDEDDEHAMDCNCARCRIIRALMYKYSSDEYQEQTASSDEQ
jgi:predicted RNA methylase